jgi:hypothetical protein
VFAVRRRVVVVTLVVVASFATSGCELLAGAGLAPSAPISPIASGATGGTVGGAVEGATSAPGLPNPTLPGDAGTGAEPKPIGAYGRGQATLTLSDGTQVVLNQINRGPHVYQQFGAQVRWTNGAGWYLTVSGAGAEADMGAPYLILDHVIGGRHLTIDDPSACTLTITSATGQSLRGSASCRSIHWTDAIDMNLDGTRRDAGVADVSAMVTFEAER